MRRIALIVALLVLLALAVQASAAIAGPRWERAVAAAYGPRWE